MANRLPGLICAGLADLPARLLLVGLQHAVQRGYAVLRPHGVARRCGAGLQNEVPEPRALEQPNEAADVAQSSANAAWVRPSWQCMVRPTSAPALPMVASSVVPLEVLEGKTSQQAMLELLELIKTTGVLPKRVAAMMNGDGLIYVSPQSLDNGSG